MPFMLQGVCPVCGNVNTVYNPPLPMHETAADKYQNQHYPYTVFRCYHKGTPHHSSTFAASSGALYPMHLFFRREDEKDYRRYFPEANDDCNKRHWKVPKGVK